MGWKHERGLLRLQQRINLGEAMQFTKEELHLLKICFEINAGDFYARHSLFTQYMKEDLGFSEKQTEELFKNIERKFKEDANGK